MGGTPGTNRDALSSTSCYDINGRSWSDFAPLNYERYFASSAVDPQGNWYVFGGYDDADNPVPFTERYDSKRDQWHVSGPEYSVVPPRAWSRGAFAGNNLWIIGGEISNPQVLNIAQWAEFPFITRVESPAALSHLPLVFKPAPRQIGNDTFQSASTIPFPGSVTDRFRTPLDTVNIYEFVVPRDQYVNINLVPLAAGNTLDIVLYTDNKGTVVKGLGPSTGKLNINERLPAGRYFVAVERIFPLPGFNPTSAQYRLSVGPG